MAQPELSWERPARDGGAWVAFAEPGSAKPPPAEHRIEREHFVIAGVMEPWPRIDTAPIRPLEANAGLFRTFADLPADHSLIDAFAASFGLLWSRPNEAEELWVDDPVGMDAEGRPAVNWKKGRGEPVSAWVREIAALRAAVRLWDLAQTRDLGELERFVRWSLEEPDYVEFAEPYVGRLHSSGRWRDDPPRSDAALEFAAGSTPIQHGDVLRPAIHMVQREINRRIADAVVSTLRWDDTLKRPSLRLVPKDLLTGMWLQFAEAVGEDKRFRKCADSMCRRWFELGTKGTRGTRQFCSDLCRTHFSRTMHRQQTTASPSAPAAPRRGRPRRGERL